MGNLARVVRRESDVRRLPVEQIVPNVRLVRRRGGIIPVPEERFLAAERGVAVRSRVAGEVVEINSVAADALGREEVRLHLVERPVRQAVVPVPGHGIVLVQILGSVGQVEPVGVQELVPLVLVIGPRQAERLERGEPKRQLARARPGLAVVPGKHSILEEPRLRRIAELVRDEARLPVLGIPPLAREVEGDLLPARNDGTAESQRGDLVSAAAAEMVAVDALEGPGVLVSALTSHHVHDARVDPPVLGVVAACLDDHLVDGLRRDVGRRESRQRILLGESVDVVGDLIGPSAADDQCVAVRDLGRGVDLIQIVQVEGDDTRLLGHRVLVSAEGLIPELLAVQEFRRPGHVLLDQGPLRLHLDFRHVLQDGRLHDEVELRSEVGEHLDPLPHLRDVAEQRDPHGVFARRQIGNVVVALRVGRRPALELRNRDRGKPNRLVGLRIRDGAADGARRSRPRFPKNKKGARHDERDDAQPPTHPRSRHDSSSHALLWKRHPRVTHLLSDVLPSPFP